MADDADLSWEQVREGLAEDLAPVEIDPATGLPMPTVRVSDAISAPLWPWILGIGVVLYLLSRK